LKQRSFYGIVSGKAFIYVELIKGHEDEEDHEHEEQNYFHR